jgi:hypothetical protein
MFAMTEKNTMENSVPTLNFVIRQMFVLFEQEKGAETRTAHTAKSPWCCSAGQALDILSGHVVWV